jgi:hypothetical protein
VKRFVAFVLLLASLVLPAASGAERPSRWRAVWHVSQVLLVGANAADTASSWGKSEANPLLRTGPRFSYGSMAIKLGFMSGSLVAQHYMARKAPRQIPFFASANLATAAVLAGVAARNTHVAPPLR